MSRDDSVPAVECTLAEQEEASRAAAAETSLIPHYEGADERENGVTVRFDGSEEALLGLAAFVADERECCSFADYRIEHSPPYDEVRLTVTGPDGTRALFGEGLIGRLERESATAD